jgi:hypothetical protein
MSGRHQGLTMKWLYNERCLVRGRTVRIAAVGAFVGILLGVGCVYAQDEDDVTFGDLPLENAVAGHNLAVRIRGEVLFTEDAEALLDDDVAYARFPSEIYDAEIRIFQNDGLSVAAEHSQWENEQGLDLQRSGLTVRAPLADNYKITWRYSTLSKNSEESDRDYLYFALSSTLGKGFYSYTQYRNTVEKGQKDVHQFSQYASWTAPKRCRFGGRAAVSIDDDNDESGPWYLDAFGSAYIWKQETSIRVSHRHYVASSDLNFDESKLYLYHSLWNRTLLRVGYRLYRDSDDMESHAYGAKIKHYLSPRGSVHAGYRLYDHKVGADFDSAYAGFSLLL